MQKYRVTVRVTGERQLEIEAPSPDAAALVALGWKSDFRTGAFLNSAKTDQDFPDIVVMDEEGRELLRFPTQDEGPIYMELDESEEGVEGASNDDDAEKGR